LDARGDLDCPEVDVSDPVVLGPGCQLALRSP
jgi:hypothetical protein